MSPGLNREQLLRAVLADVADLEWQILESDFFDSRRASDGGEPRAGGKAYVLVVDEDPGVSAGVRAFAAQRDHVCIVASTADEARELCEGLRFDCAFIDMHLPGDGGLPLVTSLRKASRPNFVVMMSGHAREEYLAALADGRIDAYVQKPLSPSLLPELLSQSLRQAET